jgi:hypothetical protein
MSPRDKQRAKRFVEEYPGKRGWLICGSRLRDSQSDLHNTIDRVIAHAVALSYVAT